MKISFVPQMAISLLISLSYFSGVALAQDPMLTPLNPKRASYGVMDTIGKVVLPEQFEDSILSVENAIIASPFSWAHKFRETVPRYLFDLNGKRLNPKPLGMIDIFSNGLVAIQNGELWGYLDNRGKLVIPYKFSSAHPFYKDYAFTYGKDGLAVINRKGDYVWKSKEHENLATNKYGINVVPIGKQLLVTQTTKNSGTYAVGWFPKGEQLYTFQDSITNLHGFIDRKAEVIVEPQFNRISQFHNGRALAEQGKEIFFIDKNGKKLNEISLAHRPGYANLGGGISIFKVIPEAANLHPQLKLFATEKYGALDTNGKICIKPEYTYLMNTGDENGLFLAVKEISGTKEVRYGFIDQHGITKIPFVYTWASEFKNGRASFTKQKVEPQFETEKGVTVAELKTLDTASRLKISEAVKGLKLNRPLRILVTIEVDGKASLKLLLGPEDPNLEKTISQKLSQIKLLPRPKALKGRGFSFEYVVLTNSVVAAGDKLDPYRIKRQRLEELNKDFNYIYCINTATELEKYLKQRAELEFAIGIQSPSYDSGCQCLIRFYIKAGRVKEALAQVERLRVLDKSRAESMEIEVFRGASMWPELASALKKQSSQAINNGDKNSAYNYLLELAITYYLLDKPGLVDSTFQKAINLIDTKPVLETGPVKQEIRTIPYSALYFYACFLASTDRLEKSAQIMEQIYQYTKPGNAFYLMTNNYTDSSREAYLAIVKEKDPKIFEHFNEMRKKRIISPELKKGLLKPDGTEICNSQLQALSDNPLNFSEGLAVAIEPFSGNCGYVDKAGSWIIAPKFYQASPFKNGKAFAKPASELFLLASASAQTKMSVIDATGKVIGVTTFDAILFGRDDISIASADNVDKILEMSLLVNEDGKVLNKDRFSYPALTESNPSGGYQFVTAGREQGGCGSLAKGHIQKYQYTKDDSGKVVEVEPVGLHTFEEKISEQNLVGYKNVAGETVISPRFLTASVFIDGLASVRDITGKELFIKEDGSNAFGEMFDSAQDFAGPVAVVSKDGKSYLIDRRGKKVSDDYRSLSAIAPGFFKILDDDNRQGLLDEKGQLLIKPQAIELRAPSEGLIAFSKEGKWGFMDLTGKEIVAPKYRTVGDFHEGLAFFQREYDNVNLKD
ncbi:MAG: WG repeat-containing protein [Candidatus Obscuribacterales bacterium]|jgi:hypothetical protein